MMKLIVTVVTLAALVAYDRFGLESKYLIYAAVLLSAFLFGVLIDYASADEGEDA